MDAKRDALRELSRQYRGNRMPKGKRPALLIVIGPAELEDDEDTVDLGTAEPMVLEDDDEDD